MCMKVEDVNNLWCRKLVEVLNARQAAILFAFGKSRDGKVTVWQTQDLNPAQMIAEIEKLLKVMKGQL